MSSVVNRLRKLFGSGDAASTLQDHPGKRADVFGGAILEETKSFYSQFLRCGDLCFDVGANIGNKTKIFLSLGARVVAVEPQSNCIEILKRKYDGDSSVVIVSQGLAAQSGSKPLSICGASDTISTFSGKWKTGRFRSYVWESVTEVTVTTLDYLIREFGVPRFCKIDVEGFEYEVLQGLSTPIPFLAFEFTCEFMADARLAVAYLGSLGRAEFNYALGETPTLVLPDWVDGATLFASLDQYADELLWGDIYVRFHQEKHAGDSSLTS